MQYFNYINPDTNELEKVEQERWCWEVVYLNEHILKQFDRSDMSFHRFGEIDQSQIHVFRMVNRDDPRKVYQILMNPSYMKPIHFYSNLISKIEVYDAQGQVKQKDELRVKVYVFGYEETYHPTIRNPQGEDITPQFKLQNTVIKHFFAIMPGDEMIITDDFDKIQLSVG